MSNVIEFTVGKVSCTYTYTFGDKLIFSVILTVRKLLME